jgi:ubiquinone biosynthesis UbiH/UbiF/VisC/COQ6 family hydroxylase
MSGTMNFDIVIVGSGLVGSAFALALRDSGLRLALVEVSVPQPLPDDASWDSRIYAITPGNAAFLESLGVWQALDHSRIAPVHEMRIWGDDGVARLDFSAYDAGVAELAFIAESRLLQDRMWRDLQCQENLKIICPAQCESIAWNEAGAELRLRDGTALTANLIVGADGANSWVRAQAGIEASPKPYKQMGVVANFATELAHGGIARQWFRRDGVLAWLPLPGKRISMVWSTWDDQARGLTAMPEDELCAAVAEAGGNALGELLLLTPAAAFPLRLLRLDTLVKPGLALIGDAAHNVHPLAGQGVNLGFKDAQILAQVLRAWGAQANCGDHLLLRRYERARREDILAMQEVTGGLQKLFNNTDPLLGAVRNLGLRLTNTQGWIKNRLMQQALR